MKIGVSSIGYQCARHMSESLIPWVTYYDKDNDHDEIVVSVSHGVFIEMAHLGCPILSTDGSIELLKKYHQNGLIKNFKILDQPAYEKDVRNSTLPELADCDYIFLLDIQDELYKECEILNIFDFLRQKENSEVSSFRINFKNYIGDENHYIEGFCPPRIWNNRLNGGVKRFYYDNEVLFNDNKKSEDLPCLIIPKEVAFVRHLSWVGSPSYLKRKIEFQKKHYGQCSYRWDDNKCRVVLNEEYYKSINQPLPVIHEESQ